MSHGRCNVSSALFGCEFRTNHLKRCKHVVVVRLDPKCCGKAGGYAVPPTQTTGGDIKAHLVRSRRIDAEPQLLLGMVRRVLDLVGG